MTPEDKLIIEHVKKLNEYKERVAALIEVVDWWQNHIRLPITPHSTTVWTAEKVMDLVDKNDSLELACRMLLARIQDEKGVHFWDRKPATDLEVAAQELAKMVPPE
jgi:uncharacterized protein YciU (UPF0263 family)